MIHPEFNEPLIHGSHPLIPAPPPATPKQQIPLPSELHLSEKNESLSSKEYIFSEHLEDELNDLLTAQEKKINQKFDEIEKRDNSIIDRDFIDSFLQIEEWGHDIISNEGTKSGKEFFESIFSCSLFEHMLPEQKREKLGHIAVIGSTLLLALDTGAKGLTYICKTKILNEAKHFVSEFKKSLENKAKPDNDQEEKKRLEIIKDIAEWETQIEVEEHKLNEEKTTLRLNMSYTVLSGMHVPLIFLHSTSLLDQFLFWGMNGFEALYLALKVKKINEEGKSLNQWLSMHKKWADDYLPKFEMSEGIMKRVNFHPKDIKMLTPEEHEEKLYQFIRLNTFTYAKNKLKEIDIHIPAKLRRKKELVSYLKIQPDTVKKYVDYHQKFESINYIISTTDNLLLKRQEIAEKKFILIKSRFNLFENKIKERQKILFESESKKNPENTTSFDEWYIQQNQDVAIRDYIDHQETIENTLKNSLKQMISKKNEIHEKFHRINSLSLKTSFTLSTALLAISGTLAILGIATTPIGGVGLIYLGLSAVTVAFGLGFFLAGYLYARKYKPEISKTMTIRFQYNLAKTQIAAFIQSYFHQMNEKKLIEVAKILQQLHKVTINPEERQSSKEYQQALAKYKIAKSNFEKSQEKIKDWNKKLTKYESAIKNAEWVDFSNYAHLKSDPKFDTLASLEEAINKSDFHLLSTEIRVLLEVYLGINVDALQIEANQDPEAIKDAFKNFFALDINKFYGFIEHQNTKLRTPHDS